MSYILKDAYELSVWDEELVVGSWVDENNNDVEPDTPGALHLLEHYKERKIAIIGADDMDTPFAANSPILTVNTNGTVTLTFKMFYHCYDEDKGKEGEFATNPYVGLLSNERKIKLKFRNKWYDFIIRNCQESSENHTFTYTARSIYVNELAKNGLKVELDDELENNQGSITELAEYILADSDWQVAPTAPIIKDENDTTLYSDIIVETQLDPIYPAILNTDIDVKVVSDYLPDATLANKEYLEIKKIKKGEQVFFFYSDLMSKNPLPHVLYRPKELTGEKKTFYKNEYEPYSGTEPRPAFLYRKISEDEVIFQTTVVGMEYEYTYTFKKADNGIYRRNYKYKPTTYELIPYNERETYQGDRYTATEITGNGGTFHKIKAIDNTDGYELLTEEEANKYDELYVAKRIAERVEEVMDYLYQTDINKDIITNAYNYRLLREIDYQEVETTANVPEIVDYTSDEDFTVSELYRGEKVIRSPETGYDPDIDKFITKYVPYEYIEYSHGEYGYLEEKDKYFKLYKYVEDEKGAYYYIKSEDYFTIEEPDNYIGLKYRKELDNDSSAFIVGDYKGNLYRRKIIDRELYGYIHTEDYSPYLAENYLSNSQEVTSFEEGWVFDGTPTTKDDASSGNVTDEEDGTFTGQVYLLNTKLPADDTEASETPRGVLVLRLRDGETMYPDATGEYIKFVEKKAGETEEVRYIEYTDDLIQDILSDLYADAKVNRENGIDGFVGKTDQQLEDIVNSAVTKMRYSKRRHRAINTGVAANRKTISTFTPGEKYVFAISLGRYKDGEDCPLYYTELSPDATEEEIERNTLKYGATAPQHLYSFIEEDETKKRAAQITKETVDKDILKNPNRYILPEWEKPDEDPEHAQYYSKVWDSIYNTYHNAYLNNYLKDNYLIDSLEFIDLGKKQKAALEKVWNYGGYKYRDYFNDTLIQNLQSAIVTKLNPDREVSWGELFEDSFKATADIKYPDLDQQDALEIDYVQEFVQFESDFQEAFGISYENTEKMADEESESKWFLPEWTVWKQFGNSTDKEIHGYIPIPQYKDYGKERFLVDYAEICYNDDNLYDLWQYFGAYLDDDDPDNVKINGGTGKHKYEDENGNKTNYIAENGISEYNNAEQDWYCLIDAMNPEVSCVSFTEEQAKVILALIQDAGHEKDKFLEDFRKHFGIDRNEDFDFNSIIKKDNGNNEEQSKCKYEHLQYILNYVSRKKYIYVKDESDTKEIKFKYKAERPEWNNVRYYKELNFLSENGECEGIITYNSYAEELKRRILANLELELGKELSVSGKETDTFKEKFTEYHITHGTNHPNFNSIVDVDQEDLYLIKGLIHSKWGQEQPFYLSNRYWLPEGKRIDSELNSKSSVINFLRGFNNAFQGEFMPQVKEATNSFHYEVKYLGGTTDPDIIREIKNNRNKYYGYNSNTKEHFSFGSFSFNFDDNLGIWIGKSEIRNYITNNPIFVQVKEPANPKLEDYKSIDIRPTFTKEESGIKGWYDGDYIQLEEKTAGAIEGSDGKFYKKITIWQKSYIFNGHDRYVMTEAPIPGYFGTLEKLTEAHKLFILTWYSERQRYENILKTVVKNTNFNLYKEVFRNQIEYNNSYDQPGVFNKDGGRMYQSEHNSYSAIATDCANIQAIAESLDAHRTGGWKYLLGLMFMRDETEDELKRQINEISLDTRDAKWKVGGVNYITALEDRQKWTKNDKYADSETTRPALPESLEEQGYYRKSDFIGLKVPAGHYAGFDRWIQIPSVINEGKIEYWPDDLPQPWNGENTQTPSKDHTNYGIIVNKDYEYNDWCICGSKYIEYFEQAFDKIYTDELRTSSYVLDKDDYKVINFPDEEKDYIYAVPIDYHNPEQRRDDVTYYVIDHKQDSNEYQYKDFCRLFKDIFGKDFLVEKEEYLKDDNGTYKWQNNKYVEISENEKYDGQKYRLASSDEIMASIKESDLLEDGKTTVKKKAEEYFNWRLTDSINKVNSLNDKYENENNKLVTNVENEKYDANKDGSYLEYGIIQILKRLHIDIIKFRKEFKEEFGYSFYEIIEEEAVDALDWNHRDFIKRFISTNSAYIRLFNPDTDLERNVYLAVSNDEGYYVCEEAENYGVDIRTLDSEDYEITQRLKMDGMEHFRPYKGKITNENGVVYYNDVIRHDWAYFDGHLGEWEGDPPRYDFSRVFTDAKDREFLELEPQDAFYEEFHGAQLTQMESWTGNILEIPKEYKYVYSGDIKKSLIKTWWENLENTIPNAKALGEKIEDFFKNLIYKEEEKPIQQEESGGPVGEAIGTVWRGIKGFFVKIIEGAEEIIVTVAEGLTDIITEPLKAAFKAIFGRDWDDFLKSALLLDNKKYRSEKNYIENQISFNLTNFKEKPETGGEESLFSGIVLPTWLTEKEKFKKNYGRAFREDWDKLVVLEYKKEEDKPRYFIEKARRTLDGRFLFHNDRTLTRKNYILESIIARYYSVTEEEEGQGASETIRKKIFDRFHEEFNKLATNQIPYFEKDKTGEYIKVDDFTFRKMTSEEMEEEGEIYETRYSPITASGRTYFDSLTTITDTEKDFILTFLCSPFRSLVDIADAELEANGKENFYNHELYVNSFIKYRWWYWRHWGKTRYRKKPKIYVHSPKNSDLDVYYPYNKYKDAGPQNYILFDTEQEAINYLQNNKYNYEELLTIKLENQEYRIIKENDYEGYRYKSRMVNKMGEEYYVQDLTYNYFRPYSKGTGYIGDGRFGRDGDGKVVVGDKHFGKWVQCYEFYRDEDGEFIYVNGLYIPYDPRLYGRAKRYKKIIDAKGNFVSNDGRYILLDEYIRRYTKEFRLDYRGLSSSFCDNYEYDSLYFAIDLNKANLNSDELTNNGFYNNDKYLNFDFNNDPAGFYETTYQEATVLEPEIKERWVYWVGTVNDNFSLTEDLLSKIGMVFQVEKDENGKINNLNKTEKNNINFALLGSQMFKYYPYTPTKGEDDIVDPEETLVIPGIAPDTKDLIVTSYYIYDPLETKDIDSIKYHYVGQDPFDKYSYLYDETCQKIRSIKGKEKNYYNLLQTACKTFNCWVDFQVEHNENGEIVYRIENLYKQNDYLPNSKGTFYKVRITTFTIDDKGNVVGTPRQVISYKELVNDQIILQNTTEGNTTTIYELLDKDNNVIEGDKPDTYYIHEEEPLIYVGKVSYEAIGKYINDEDVLKADDIQYIKDSLGGYYIDSEGNYALIPKGLYPDTTYRKELKPTEEEISHRKRKAAMAILGEVSKEDWLEPWENLKTYKFEDFFYKELIKVPKKTVVFKRYVGKENWSGFKYGVNLKSIQRTLDSEQIVSKIIIKSNKNEHAKDGMCTVQRAKENPIKENFAYNFDYYIRQEMLDKSILDADLYQGYGDKLNYYNALARLNRNNDEIAERLAALSIQIDKLRADYEIAVLARDAAEEEIAHLAETLNNNYDSYGQLIDTPWTFNKAKQYASRNTTTTQGYEKEVSVVQDNGEVYKYMVYVEEQVATVDYPLYNDQLRNLFNQMDEHMRNQNSYGVAAKDLKNKLEKAEKEYEDLVKQQAHIAEKKNGLNKLFFHKYSRFIQEGSWNSEEYIDDNLYYLDGLSTLRGSISPKVSYAIQVVDLSKLEGYEVLNFEIGDKTYIEDPEFFGYNPITGKPYQEEIIINEIAYNLEDPGSTQIKVANFSSQFENLFQRAAATANTLQLNQGTYGSGSRLMNADGSVNTSVIQSTITTATDILSAATSENVYWDNTGITVTSTKTASSVVKIVSQGILISSDGGNHFTTAITGSGVNAALLTAGKLNVDKVIIGASSTPNFLWDRNGITAFRRSISGIDYSTFVRMDEYGIYGISGFSKNNIAIDKMSINDVFEPGNDTTLIKEWASFGLTWDGFFLNTGAGNDKGRVVIGTGQDLKMSSFLPETGKWLDRVIIGKLQDKNGNDYYGFRLTDKFGRINLDTDRSGELYLRRKLRISNFTTNKIYPIDSEEKIVYQNVEYDDWSEDRVTLGIVETYKRNGTLANGNLTFEPAKEEMDNDYSSAEYLTKVFSIRTNAQVKLEPFKAEHIEQVIDRTGNETFAIFDNGNLYARNAWVEGRIDATGGTISGNMDVTGILKVGPKDRYIRINGKLGTIYTHDYFPGEKGWMISPLLAEFENGKFRGALLDTLIETVKVQTIGGAVMLARSAKILKVDYKESENYNEQPFNCTVILEGTDLFKRDFLPEDKNPEVEASLMENESNKYEPDLNETLKKLEENEKAELIVDYSVKITTIPYYCYDSNFKNLNNFSSSKEPNSQNYGCYRLLNTIETINYEGQPCTKITLYLESEDEAKELEKRLSLAFFKLDPVQTINEQEERLEFKTIDYKFDCGISLSTTEVSDQNGLLLNRAIHIFDVNPLEGNLSTNGIRTRVILGKIPDEQKYGFIKGKNGLYAENAMIVGTIATQNIVRYTGMSSNAIAIQPYDFFNVLEKNQKIMPVLWSTALNENQDTIDKINIIYNELTKNNSEFYNNNAWYDDNEISLNNSNAVFSKDNNNSNFELQCAIIVKNIFKEYNENTTFQQGLNLYIFENDQDSIASWLDDNNKISQTAKYSQILDFIDNYIEQVTINKKGKITEKPEELSVGQPDTRPDKKSLLGMFIDFWQKSIEKNSWADFTDEATDKLASEKGIFNNNISATEEFGEYSQISFEKGIEYLRNFIFEVFKRNVEYLLDEYGLTQKESSNFWISDQGSLFGKQILGISGVFQDLEARNSFSLYKGLDVTTTTKTVLYENNIFKYTKSSDDPTEYSALDNTHFKSSVSAWIFSTEGISCEQLSNIPSKYTTNGSLSNEILGTNNIIYSSSQNKEYIYFLDYKINNKHNVKSAYVPLLFITYDSNSTATSLTEILSIDNTSFTIYRNNTIERSLELKDLETFGLSYKVNGVSLLNISQASAKINTEEYYFSNRIIIKRAAEGEGVDEIIL